jgi:hypothetical protein
VNEPLDELYLQWLYRQVADEHAQDPSITFWTLLRQLYTTEFVWFVDHDDNRLEDGRDLRLEFVRDTGEHDIDRSWVELGCSFLELMVGLARRLAFEAESGEPHYWFWHLMENIELHEFSDDLEPFPHAEVEEIVERVIHRLYGHDGVGGFFPLRRPPNDQRRVELRYQLGYYVLENNY